MKDKKFLTWLHERLQYMHGENPSVDYMHKLRSIIEVMDEDVDTHMKLDADVSNWISVDDKLPKSGKWYLIMTKLERGEVITTMAFLDVHELNGEKLVSWLSQNDTDSDEWSNVTHYQPLPKPKAES